MTLRAHWVTLTDDLNLAPCPQPPRQEDLDNPPQYRPPVHIPASHFSWSTLPCRAAWLVGRRAHDGEWARPTMESGALIWMTEGGHGGTRRQEHLEEDEAPFVPPPLALVPVYSQPPAAPPHVTPAACVVDVGTNSVRLETERDHAPLQVRTR